MPLLTTLGTQYAVTADYVDCITSTPRVITLGQGPTIMQNISFFCNAGCANSNVCRLPPCPNSRLCGWQQMGRSSKWREAAIIVKKNAFLSASDHASPYRFGASMHG
jgi:hypothetical protein